MNLRNAVKYLFLAFGVKIIWVGSQPYYMKRMFDKVLDVEGDIVECGVGKMDTFTVLAGLLCDRNSDKKLVGFDSFEGFPEPSEEDASVRDPQKGEWKYIDANDVPKFLLVLGFDENWINTKVEVVKGFFKDTLPKSSIKKIALLHLDVDLYDSYKVCLTELFPRVSKGGVVLFDEYENADENVKWPGAKKAIDEYFKGTDYQISRDKLSGKYYLIKK